MASRRMLEYLARLEDRLDDRAVSEILTGRARTVGAADVLRAMLGEEPHTPPIDCGEASDE